VHVYCHSGTASKKMPVLAKQATKRHKIMRRSAVSELACCQECFHPVGDLPGGTGELRE
jgi:hypothetical protein